MTLALERPASADRLRLTGRIATDGHASEHEPAADADADRVARVESLVRRHLPLVGHMVRETANRVPAHVNRDDLTSAAMFALAKSAQSFDPRLGTSFAGFATIRIRGAITDELRSMDWASRGVRGKGRNVEATRQALSQTLGRGVSDIEVAAALGISVRELAACEADIARASVMSLHALSPEHSEDLLPSHEEGPENMLLRREQLGYLHDAVSELPERLRFVVEQYFFAQRRMVDIAAELGVTESRVSQLRSEALVLMREGMRASGDGTETTPPTTTHRGARAAGRQAYVRAVAARSTLAQRLAATTLLGEQHA